MYTTPIVVFGDVAAIAMANVVDVAFIGFFVSYALIICFMNDRHKTKLRGSNNGRNGQCGGCRAPATWQENDDGRAYVGGYSEPFYYSRQLRVSGLIVPPSER